MKTCEKQLIVDPLAQCVELSTVMITFSQILEVHC